MKQKCGSSKTFVDIAAAFADQISCASKLLSEGLHQKMLVTMNDKKEELKSLEDAALMKLLVNGGIGKLHFTRVSR